MRHTHIDGNQMGFKKGAEKDRLLNVEQVRQRLDLARSTVYKLINEGKLKGFSLVGYKGIRVRESVLEEYIKERESAYGA